MTGLRRRGALTILATAALLGAALAGCASGVPSGATFPPVGSTTAPAGDANAAAKAAILAALAVEGLQATDANVAYRPAEGARFAAAPRTVLQVTLPTDPSGGYIVLYALGSPAAALEAATDQAAYIATGPGRVQFMLDTRYTLRVLGSTAIFFNWSPANSPDPQTPSIDLALSQVGTEVPIPN